MDGTLSASDVALLNGNGGMWGNNGIEWLFAIILLGAVGGNGFFGGNVRGNAATTEDLASGFNFSALQNKTNETLAAVNNVNQVIGNAICQLGYQVLQQFSSMEKLFSDCCCQILRGIDSVKFDMANYFAAANANTNAGIQKILDRMCADKEAAQAARIQQLELNQALCGVVRYPTTMTYATSCNPFFGAYSGYNCGCNNI